MMLDKQDETCINILKLSNSGYRSEPEIFMEEQDRRPKFACLTKLFLLLFCLFLYIPIYCYQNTDFSHSSGRKQSGASIPGWPHYISKDTKLYVPPNNPTSLHEPKQACRPIEGKNNNIFLLIVVFSSTENFDQRMAVRGSWGNHRNYRVASKVYGRIKKKYTNYNMSFEDLWITEIEEMNKNFSMPTDKIVKKLKQQWINANLPGEESEDSFNEDEDTKPVKITGHNKTIKNETTFRHTNNNSRGQAKFEYGLDFKVVFLLGLPKKKSIQIEIDEEVRRYGDVIQEKFVDLYNNLTLKSITMLKWITMNCRGRVRYILKTDDDIFINVPNLVYNLKRRSSDFDKEHKENDKEYLLIGDAMFGNIPEHNASSKWFSPYYMFGGRVYPMYISGSGYVMTMHSAQALYEASKITPFFHFEDIYVTGLCAVHAYPQIKPRDDPTFGDFVMANCDVCCAHKHVTLHRVPPLAMGALMQLLCEYSLLDQCEFAELRVVERQRRLCVLYEQLSLPHSECL